MPILLWITIEMGYKIKCLKKFLWFTNSRQKKSTLKGLTVISTFLVVAKLFVVLTLRVRTSHRALVFCMNLTEATLIVIVSLCWIVCFQGEMGAKGMKGNTGRTGAVGRRVSDVRTTIRTYLLGLHSFLSWCICRLHSHLLCRVWNIRIIVYQCYSSIVNINEVPQVFLSF